MEIFISWSGEESHQVAQVLERWIPSVLQAVKPFLSSENIDSGTRWANEIGKQLESNTYGIVCVTPSNLTAPWLYFEAGAIAKSLEGSHVVPILHGLKKSEVGNPLAQFQMRNLSEFEDMRALIRDLNAMAGDAAIEATRLDAIFNVWWPELEGALPVLGAAKPTVNRRPASDLNESPILEEILEILRTQQRLLASPDLLLPQGYLESALRKRDVNPDALRDLGNRYLELGDHLRTVDALPDDEWRPFLGLLYDRLGAPLEYLLNAIDDRDLALRVERNRSKNRRAMDSDKRLRKVLKNAGNHLGENDASSIP